MLSKGTIDEFRQILYEDYSENVDTKEATEMAEDLVSYFDLLLKISCENQEKYELSKNAR